jgi:hypothetical protein
VIENGIPVVTLPTAKTPKVTDLSRQRILLYGVAKSGKSTWCSRAPDAFFLDCENGLQSLETYKKTCTTWDEVRGTVRALRAGGHGYKTVVVDTVGAAHRLAQEDVLSKHKAEWLTDGSLSYGKGRGLTTNAIVMLLKALSDPALGLGLYLVAHEKQETVPDRFGGEIIRTGPDLHEAIVQYVIGWADMVLRVGYETVGEGDAAVINRRLYSQGSDHLVAGDRTGLLPAVMDLSFPKFQKSYEAAVALNGKAKGKKEEKA